MSSCTFTRVAVAAPVLTLPAFAMHFLEQRPLLKARPWLRVPTVLLLLGVCIQVHEQAAFLYNQQQSHHCGAGLVGRCLCHSPLVCSAKLLA